MPSRQAILIESSILASHPTLAGARADAANLGSFLLEDHAGAWEQDEIALLHNPSVADVRSVLREAATKDYVFLAFSGHGYHVRGRSLEEDRICLGSTEEMAVSELNPGTARFTCLIDTCRKVEAAPLVLEARKFANAAKALKYDYRWRCRQLFDDALSNSERGTISLFSCDLDEAAGETKEGGYFTSSLLDSANVWKDSLSGGLSSSLDLYSAFTRSVDAVHRTSHNQQHPQFQGGRRLRYFPWAVRP